MNTPIPSNIQKDLIQEEYTQEESIQQKLENKK